MSDEQPVTNEGALPQEDTITQLEALKKGFAELQQNYAIIEHTARVQGENLNRVQQESISLRAACVEFQSHIFTLCKALGKAMS